MTCFLKAYVDQSSEFANELMTLQCSIVLSQVVSA